MCSALDVLCSGCALLWMCSALDVLCSGAAFLAPPLADADLDVHFLSTVKADVMFAAVIDDDTFLLLLLLPPPSPPPSSSSSSSERPTVSFILERGFPDVGFTFDLRLGTFGVQLFISISKCKRRRGEGADTQRAELCPRQHSEAPWQHSEAPRQHSEAPWQHSEAPWQHSEAPWQHSEAPRQHSEAPPGSCSQTAAGRQTTFPSSPLSAPEPASSGGCLRIASTVLGTAGTCSRRMAVCLGFRAAASAAGSQPAADLSSILRAGSVPVLPQTGMASPPPPSPSSSAARSAELQLKGNTLLFHHQGNSSSDCRIFNVTHVRGRGPDPDLDVKQVHDQSDTNVLMQTMQQRVALIQHQSLQHHHLKLISTFFTFIP
ncbi:uncharacterized protein V6R79_009612 [Siganus canaliculatus]